MSKTELQSRIKQLKQTKLKKKKDELMNRIHKCTKKIKMNETIEDGKEYEIDKIIDMKMNESNQPLYKVLWKGYSKKECTWEPFEHFNSSSVQKVFEFQQSQKEKIKKLRQLQQNLKKKESNLLDNTSLDSSDSSFNPDDAENSIVRESKNSLTTPKEKQFKMSQIFQKQTKAGTVQFVIEYLPDKQGSFIYFVDQLQKDPDQKSLNEFKKLIDNFEKQIQL